ncbi:winged helix-turn-helix domain-containing protein [Ferrimonas kyonanensis]|uniref:winged helix-turn-helix domain-containing protein n=1 Tax=Ferrimonas kyonanensis TaxID=364763 RepID=UPI00040656E4|nr:winged helix-turn-helix domain-containing protein [Ferrimonas kyonanensis]
MTTPTLIFTSPSHRFELATQPVPQLTVKANHQLQADPIAMTNAEIQLLKLLLSQPGEVVSRTLILDRIWGNRMVSQGSINQLVSSVRALLSPYSQNHKLIVTVPRQGYYLASYQAVQPAFASQPGEPTVTTPSRRWWPLMLLLAPALAMAAVSWWSTTPQHRTQPRWQQFGQLQLLVQPNPYPDLPALTEALKLRYQDTPEPLSLVLTPFDDFMLFDCVYHKPAWVRQRQFSLPLSPPSELAESILSRCFAEGGYR